MKALKQLNTSNWAVCLLSVSLVAVAASNWMRPTSVSAQQPVPAVRKPLSNETRTVLTALQDAFVNVADNVEPSVVTIRATSQPRERPNRPMREPMREMDEPDVPEPFRDFFRRMPRGEGGPGRPSQASGSGVIIRESGNSVYVLTNNHVVDGQDRYKVIMHNRTEIGAELVGTDSRSDLAVLKFQVKRPLPSGSVARLGDSDQVKAGQWAIAIGSPLGYDSTLTVGVISAKGRQLDGLGQGASYVDLIQTDASINRGNSGGPLVNLDGEVVGINVAIAADGMSQGSIGIGFAIPVNTAKLVSEQLITKGKVTRGFLGVQVSQDNRELSAELREHLNTPTGGALAESVSPDGPAARGGMKDGDVIVKFGERVVSNFTDLEKAVAATRPGSAVPVEVVREGKAVRLNITVIERPAEKDLAGRLGGDGPLVPGAPDVKPVKSKYGLTMRAAEEGGGAEIVSVAPGTPASDAGLQPNDVITHVGRTPTPSLDAFQSAINATPSNAGIVLRVKSARGTRFVVVRP